MIGPNGDRPNGPSSLRVYKFRLQRDRGGGHAVVFARTPAEARQVAVAHAQKLGRDGTSLVAERWIVEAGMAEEVADKARVIAWAEC